MNKRTYIIPDTTVVKLDTAPMMSASGFSGNPNNEEDPTPDPNSDYSDEPSRSRYNCWDDEEEDF